MKNKIRLFSIITAFLLIVGMSAGQINAVASPHENTGVKRVIVTFDHAINEEARYALENLGGRVLKDLPLVNGFVVLIPDNQNGNITPQLKGMRGVKSVEEDVEVFALDMPVSNAKPPWAGGGKKGDKEQPPQTLEWGVDRIDADLVWGDSTGSGIDVAIIDTGIDSDHPDLAANIKGGVNFVSKPSWKPADPAKWNDDNGHGTHVAGIVAAADNDIGVIGVASNANLWAVKVLDKNGSGYVSDIIEGIEWSIVNNMDVINMSLGTSSDVQALHDAVDAAYEAGIVVVAAAGNSGDGNGSTNEVIYPAKYSSVIAVSATAEDDSTPVWSAEGEEVEIAAPGVSIRSTWNDGFYNTISGTSMASPHVAGVVALILATAVPSSYDLDGDGVWDPQEVRNNLISSADDLGPAGFDNFYGNGLVDAEESVTGVETN